MNIPRRVPLTLFTCVLQAWAFATGVRLVLQKVPFMNMENFDKDIWYLHRRLFHRFMKYNKYFRQATEKLPAFVRVKNNESNTVKQTYVAGVPTPAPTKTTSMTSVISLVSSSSDEVSEDEADESLTEEDDKGGDDEDEEDEETESLTEEDEEGDDDEEGVDDEEGDDDDYDDEEEEDEGDEDEDEDEGDDNEGDDNEGDDDEEENDHSDVSAVLDNDEDVIAM